MIANYIQYLPIILFGQIVYLYSEKKMSTKSSGLLFALCFIVLMQNVRLFFPDAYAGVTDLKSASIIIGVAIFIIFYAINEKLSDNAIVRGIDKVSYSLYLSHYQIAQLFLPWFIGFLDGNANLALAATIVLIVAVAIFETAILKLLFKSINFVIRRCKK